MITAQIHISVSHLITYPLFISLFHFEECFFHSRVFFWTIIKFHYGKKEGNIGYNDKIEATVGCPKCGAASTHNVVDNGGYTARCNKCGHSFMIYMKQGSVDRVQRGAG